MCLESRRWSNMPFNCMPVPLVSLITQFVKINNTENRKLVCENRTCTLDEHQPVYSHPDTLVELQNNTITRPIVIIDAIVNVGISHGNGTV